MIETASDLPLVIVAGGQGTRMWPLSRRVPKALLPVRGIPLLDHQLSWLREQGVRRVVACLGHFGESIETHLATSTAARGLNIAISNEGEATLGTAGAVRLAVERGLLRGRFFTLYGDTIPAINLTAARRTWEASGASALLCVYPTPNRTDEARAEVRNGRVERFSRYPSDTERTTMTHGDYGISGFDTSQFANLVPWTRSGFGIIHADLAVRGELAAFDGGAPPIEVGNLEAYARAQLPVENPSLSTDGSQSSNR